VIRLKNRTKIKLLSKIEDLNGKVYFELRQVKNKEKVYYER